MEREVNDRPNLLYIHSDQHNPAVLGCYGDPVVDTPHLDRLAAQGVVLDHLYCPSPICVPSRMSTLTGRFPYENEVWTNNHSLSSAIPTLAHAMGAAGYRPAIIGRMHSIGPDQLLGYAERLVGDHSPNHVGGQAVSHGMLNGTAGPARVSLEKSGPGQSAYQVHDEDVAVAAVEYLNQIGRKRQTGDTAEPFSLTVGLMLPHQPFVARREDYERYRGAVTMPKHPEPFSDAVHPFLRWWRERCGIVEVSDDEVLRARTAYWALVSRLDTLIGDILTALHENDLADNTLIMYSSDHGDQVGEHGLWWKQTFYEGSVTVPGILSWPGVLPEGERSERVVSALDLSATMLDALGAPPLPSSRGRSLLPLLRSEDTVWDDEAFSEMCTDDGWYKRMIRSDEWKLCYYHGYEPQLFNLREDPDELHDRAQDPACRDVRKALTSRVLDGWDPEWVARQMELKRQEAALLRTWAEHTEPPDQFRWGLRPEMSYLDEEDR
ncbi:MAG: sulfatase [Dehalococcoidia bacterium]|nr:sulfatase [Dehalococcoidia bacterium]